ncbi:sulfotransferase [Marinicella sp. S1101]|uniref:sulfotransferase family protein n=1 Tax=Marinicella marina TaxID=2996016 RepID=UPI002260DFA5|nr:sulfotransferase [Marinicella marina]MCX7553241.1 sulfotransferase [Marinicella marina]MDJ1138973.1 sulfotransferase [Marinicella marina]
MNQYSDKKTDPEMNPKLMFVTGIQKSGTSLLNRVLMAQGFIENPFLPEGKLFWGDDPVTNPSSAPCGTVYQKHLGQKGHQMLADDFTPDQHELLTLKIKRAAVKTPVLMNKNPNLIVRLPWLKKVFPTCKIVVVLREPVANIYSFSKKLYREKQSAADFWWGVKPNNWQKLIDEDALKQIVAVWQAVFEFLLQHIEHVDMFINYQQFCESPQHHLEQIASTLGQSAQQISLPFEQLTCMDDEFKKGGSLESKNVLLRREKSFSISASAPEEISYPPFSTKQIKWIKAETEALWQKLNTTINSNKHRAG